MLRSKHLVGLILAATLMATLIPFSATVYAQNSEEKRAEKFVELAERAGDKVKNFIEIIYSNETAVKNITDAGLDDELEYCNETLVEAWGQGNLTEARDSLDAADYSGAIGNATEALSAFREAFKALNTILTEAEIERGQLIDAQGLIEAMKRALDRIKRIEDMEPPPPDEVSKILDSAKEYLDIGTAIEWLSEGRVNQTAWNLTQANKLIGLAHSLLKKKAGELNDKRIESYLNVLSNFYNRVERFLDKAEADKAELVDVDNFIGNATESYTAGDFRNAIGNLTEARNLLEQIWREYVKTKKG